MIQLVRKGEREMQKRSILTLVLLFIFTFGIYPIIWTYKFQSDLKRQTGKGFGGLGHLFMILVTFGIYFIYWQYAAGKRLAEQGAQDQSVLYLVLIFFGVGSILNPVLMQSAANDL